MEMNQLLANLKSRVYFRSPQVFWVIEYYSREQPSFLFCFQYRSSQKMAKEKTHMKKSIRSEDVWRVLNKISICFKKYWIGKIIAELKADMLIQIIFCSLSFMPFSKLKKKKNQCFHLIEQSTRIRDLEMTK